jgi:hypothetical protein
MGRPVFYTSRKVKSFLRRQIMNKVVSSTLTMDHGRGKARHDAFDGIPVKRVDQLAANEAVVS